ncbi:TIGR02646 family protein [Vibrio parahaemolyticus]|uniref:retron system putative HNH endonuclease n=1 Tax=Vibrio parahaemolyticus TaxID=670 RepID=UPI0011241192|nr:retron system putative HNH endonuclease [Vibrio parahaemolyticus]TOH59280.1 TIGR02646 family protein [Vibrio parahaemolyticus]
MKKINKLAEPKSLITYRQLPDARYDGPKFTPVKQDIRERLLKEQGHLCAYCMARIKINDMKVEHFSCRDKHPALQLTYSNLLGCCKGNEGQSRNQQTCDTRKGNNCLQYSPSILSHKIESRFSYTPRGKLFSSDLTFDQQINNVLNLNYTRLVDNRLAALDGALRELNRRPGTRTKAEIQRLINKYSAKDTQDRFKSYYGFVLSELVKRHRRAP